MTPEEQYNEEVFGWDIGEPPEAQEVGGADGPITGPKPF